jgi:hypothetical protein
VVVHTFNTSTWEAEAGGFLSWKLAWSSLVYRVSSRTARVTQRNPVSEKKKKVKGHRVSGKKKVKGHRTKMSTVRSREMDQQLKSTDCFSRGSEFNSQHHIVTHSHL